MFGKMMAKKIEEGIKAYIEKKLKINLSVLESVGITIPLTQEIINALMAVAKVIGIPFTAIKEASDAAKSHRGQAGKNRAAAQQLVQQASKMDERATQLEALVALAPLAPDGAK